MIVGNAFFHTTSMKMKADLIAEPCEVTFSVPIRFTSSPASPVLNANDPNFHYYSTAVMSFTTNCTDIDEYSPLSARNVVLFPNPANDNVQVNIRTNGNSNLEVSILNIVGQELHSQRITTSQGQTTAVINVSDLPPGMYLVNLKSGSSIISKKLVIE
jgi:hypothetical protein